LSIRSRDIDIVNLESSTSKTHPHLSSPSQAEIPQPIWKDQWYSQFDWLDFSTDLGRVFYKVCKDKGERLVYTREGFKYLKVSTFQDHGCSNGMDTYK